MAAKHPTEIERANRMFAIESAVKLGFNDKAPSPVETARQFFDFLQESPTIQPTPVGFSSDTEYER